MKEPVKFKPFGNLRIQPPSEKNLTSTLETTEWRELTEYWRILMYLTQPDSSGPIEKPSITITFSEEASK